MDRLGRMMNIFSEKNGSVIVELKSPPIIRHGLYVQSLSTDQLFSWEKFTNMAAFRQLHESNKCAKVCLKEDSLLGKKANPFENSKES